MRRLLGLILTFLIVQPVFAGQQQRPQQGQQGQQQPQMTPFGNGPAFPYDERTDPRLFDPNWVPRVFVLKYVEPNWIRTLLFPYGAIVQTQDSLNSVAVRAPAAVIDSIAQLIKQMDTPANAKKSVELTGYLILGTPVAVATADPIPPALKPVIDQLKNVLAYKSYSVVDTIIGRTMEGNRIEMNGSAARTADAAPALTRYQLQLTPNVTGEGNSQSVRLVVNFNGNMQGQNVREDNTPVGISSTLDIRVGQQVVVGKSTIRDYALILVMSTKLVD